MDGNINYVELEPSVSGRQYLFNTFQLSFGFLFVFLAFNGTQSLETSLNGNLGHWAIASIYISFSVCSFLFSSSIVSYFQPKLSIVFGAIPYIIYIGIHLYFEIFTAIPAGILLGLGASIIWAGEGAYLTASARSYSKAEKKEDGDALGRFNGIFWAIFQLTQFIGNLLSSIVLMSSNKENATKVLYYVYIAISGVGLFILVFLKPINVNIKSSFSNRVKETLLLWKEASIWLLIPMMFYSGISQGFFYSDFTSQIITPSKGSNWIGFVLASFGLIDAISCFVLGRLADYLSWGHKFAAFVGLVTQFVCLSLFLIVETQGITATFFNTHYYLLFISACIWGVGDAAWNTLPNIMMGFFYPNKTEGSFSILKFWQSVGFGAGFILGLNTTFQIRILIVAGSLGLCIIGIAICDRCVQSIDSAKKEESLMNI